MQKRPKDLTKKDLLQQISRKLDKLTGLLALQNKPLDKQITILTSLSLSSFAIGAILDKSPDYVRTLRSAKRKDAGGGVRKPRKR